MRLIDADTLLRKMKKVSTEAWKMNTISKVEHIWNQAIDFINNATTVGEWIPVSERLPEKEKWTNKTNWTKYLVQTEDGSMWTLTYADGWNNYMNKDGKIISYWQINNVVAWMPLPEPYKGCDTE